MKKILSFLLLALVTFQCSGQRMGARNYNFGTAKKLNGSVCVVTVFIEDGYIITQSEKDYYTQSLKEAEMYLQKKAGEYGKYVRFTNKICQESYTYSLSKPITSASPDNIMRMIKGSSYDSYLNQLLNSYTSVILNICVHLDRSKRNFCWMNNQGCRDNLLEGVTVNLTYHAKNNMPGIIAHETLHCFGARDFYKIGNIGTFNSSDFSSYDSKMENSIMGPMYDSNINSYDIDDATAYLVGFTDVYKEWFNQLYYKGIN